MFGGVFLSVLSFRFFFSFSYVVAESLDAFLFFSSGCSFSRSLHFSIEALSAREQMDARHRATRFGWLKWLDRSY